MEILAPAGSKESFLAAIKAGAGSVYVGLKDFNARKGAPNLDFHDLEVLTAYAHSRNVKVYLTLNILIKHDEMNEAVKLVARVAALGVDAVIVQDLGLARIIKDHFPDLRLHASTQLACHNSEGARALAELGFKRVVLARELTLSEIKLITSACRSIEYEMFVHGALCFSVSGMCLFSSLLNGNSGNRGRCAQPCRRLWNGRGAKGYLFSPKDLELFGLMDKIRKTGVCSLKIEGRMRSSEYVFKAVSQYAAGQKGEDLGREKTTCLMSGRDEKLFEPWKAQCMGVKIGEFPHFKARRGDRIRIVDPKTDRSCIFKYGMEKPDTRAFRKGNPVYLAGTAAFDTEALTRELKTIYADYRGKAKSPGPLSNQYTNLTARVWPTEKFKTGKLWFRINDPGWIKLLGSRNIIYSVNKENLRDIPWGAAVELPPFIAEREMTSYKGIKARTFVLNNISHLRLVPPDAVKIAGPYLYAWNAYAARALTDLGVSRFFTSWEDDELNIRRLKFPLIVSLYGRPVITRSRMLTKEQDYGTVISPSSGMELEQVMESGMSLLITRLPVMLFSAKDKFRAMGVSEFCLDLSYTAPDPELLKGLLHAFKTGKNPGPSVKFNFHRGVE